jgi:hypothetical protein
LKGSIKNQKSKIKNINVNERSLKSLLIIAEIHFTICLKTGWAFASEIEKLKKKPITYNYCVRRLM